MRLANPNVDPWLPGVDAELLVPSSYILPDAPREGIVINVPEMRLYYYPESKPDSARLVATYPISVGRQDWSTPHKETKIIGKKADPTWYPPASSRKEHAENGDPLPKVVRPGPDNPLGRYALRLGVPGYLIHGTNKPYGVGMRVTHGCIRLYPENIERLFNDIAVGTSVRIVNQPFKVGWLNGVLHLEIHPYLAEDEDKFRDQHARIVEKIIEKSRGIPYEIDWNALGTAITAANGIPTSIGRRKAASVTSVGEDLILRPTSQW
jgi:L,D-transpeptidase ErfK/SrfK